ncbi:alkaline phosphatase family protein [Colwellia sp. 1_MG-2023]|uniref:alkaline phosphatase family protein n=1 Tax=Colwellia sp. 1_MG-2023 TaxID=3062649 RepID=UPI0026E13F1B|nr:alkaline phosphatase family protein [Colwellia sp. 1_MG-2023]MDO6445340.1 alkaline phosphatase family protein [Colwellia sp. 1_MG-2023]
MKFIINKLSTLPALLSGPIIRHVEANQLTFWLATSKPFPLTFKLFHDNVSLFDRALTSQEQQIITIGQQAFIHLIAIDFDQPLPYQTLLHYDFEFNDDGVAQSISEQLPEFLYQDEKLPNFIITRDINTMLHGSCRKPHFDSTDGLQQVDNVIANSFEGDDERPAMLMMSGDQIYADDVAGPTLVAIHQVIELLGLYHESWQGAVVNDSDGLFNSELCYYQRDQLLPYTKANKALYESFFAASKKPIFTSVNSKNHLVTFSENIAMYLLVWSPQLWQLVDFSKAKIPVEYQTQYQQEQVIIEDFIRGLPKVRRALAHIPSYMIFDDHDITDDWNLTRGWEEAAYGHPFSKRIIGNSLISYWLCQGWGNAPKKFTTLNEQCDNFFTDKGINQHSELVEKLLDWQQWHYSLATTPKVVVLDTRTQRWRSESRASKPSGLMDWEALSELQQELINEPKVILVSPAPIYGVKMIETIQRIFTFFGQPLMVDAENWMAHSGTANVMLNIFRHVKTPPEFIILSGDVHYSFVYDVTHRFQRSNSKIVQITCSGIKNQFPAKLLSWLDTLNRYLYAPYSPLNWFTKRRSMKIRVRKPNDVDDNTLYNGSGIGLITLTDDEHIVQASVICADNNTVNFHAKDELAE